MLHVLDFISKFPQYQSVPRIHLRVQGKTSHNIMPLCKVFTSIVGEILPEIIELGLTG